MSVSSVELKGHSACSGHAGLYRSGCASICHVVDVGVADVVIRAADGALGPGRGAPERERARNACAHAVVTWVVPSAAQSARRAARGGEGARRAVKAQRRTGNVEVGSGAAGLARCFVRVAPRGVVTTSVARLAVAEELLPRIGLKVPAGHGSHTMLVAAPSAS